MALSTFAGGRLWGVRYGTGTPWILALHGWGRDHADFDAVLGGLDAIALDLPGHGAAPEPPGPWSTAEYAQWVAPVLGDMGTEPVVIAGHSFGGRVALRLAALALEDGAGDGLSDRLAGLVLVGTPLASPPGHKGNRIAVRYRLGRVLHDSGLLSASRMERLRLQHGSDDYKRSSPVMRGVLVKAVNETASGQYLPLLRAWVAAGKSLEVICGEHDTAAPAAALRAATRDVPSVTMTVVPGAGHLMNAGVVAALEAALLRQRPGS
ncbi:MAG TPA: alpha/beta hydrolase [Acidimicrobiales bacterium]|nr:alpha/beta hydrolase [Acidimicrobiales bacterium]